jgi:hypothetical protein
VPRRFKAPITRKGNVFRVNLDAQELGLVMGLLGGLRTLLLGPSDDERLKRLFPTAYHQAGDSEMDDEYQRLMREDLVASRLSGIGAVEAALSPTIGRPGKQTPELTGDEMLAMMQAINGLRLVLGTMLDVSEEHDLDEVAADDPLLREYHLYGYLSWVLESCVAALQS